MYKPQNKEYLLVRGINVISLLQTTTLGVAQYNAELIHD